MSAASRGTGGVGRRRRPAAAVDDDPLGAAEAVRRYGGGVGRSDIPLPPTTTDSVGRRRRPAAAVDDDPLGVAAAVQLYDGGVGRSDIPLPPTTTGRSSRIELTKRDSGRDCGEYDDERGGDAVWVGNPKGGRKEFCKNSAKEETKGILGPLFAKEGKTTGGSMKTARRRSREKRPSSEEKVPEDGVFVFDDPDDGAEQDDALRKGATPPSTPRRHQQRAQDGGGGALSLSPLSMERASSRQSMYSPKLRDSEKPLHARPVEFGTPPSEEDKLDEWRPVVGYAGPDEPGTPPREEGQLDEWRKGLHARPVEFGTPPSDEGKLDEWRPVGYSDRGKKRSGRSTTLSMPPDLSTPRREEEDPFVAMVEVISSTASNETQTQRQNKSAGGSDGSLRDKGGAANEFCFTRRNNALISRTKPSDPLVEDENTGVTDPSVQDERTPFKKLPKKKPRRKQISKHTCYGCLKVVEKRKDNMYACARCRCAYYCSTECQSASWNGSGQFSPQIRYEMENPRTLNQGHKYWCFDLTRATEKAGEMMEDYFDGSDKEGNLYLLFSDNVYKSAVINHDLHGRLLEGMHHAIEDFREIAENGMQDDTDDLDLMEHSGCTFTCFFSGAITDTINGKPYFLRFAYEHGEQCIDERRFFGFIASNDAAWDTLLAVAVEAVMFHYHDHDSCTLKILKELQFQLKEDEEIFFRHLQMALSVDSVAIYVLAQYAGSTARALNNAVDAILDRKDQITPDGEVYEIGFELFVLMTILREQAKRLKGREWADQFVSLDSVLSKRGLRNAARTADEYYSVDARAIALQFILCGGKLPPRSTQAHEDHMAWCKRSRDSI